jgi:hypothetical protein
MSGVFVHTPQKRVMCIKCRQAEEADKRNEELKQKWKDKHD